MSQLEQVRFDEGALAHADARRNIYDPLQGIQGNWHVHNVIAINQAGLELGKHSHDYQELFFTPTGGFYFALADIDEKKPQVYQLDKGKRILIPPNVGHIVVGDAGAILNGFGDVPFDPKRMYACDSELVGILHNALFVKRQEKTRADE